MYEIDLSTVMLIGLNEERTKVITLDNEFIIDINSKKIIDNSCKFFGSSLNERVNTTKRLININSKSPIIVEESRNIIFFHLSLLEISVIFGFLSIICQNMLNLMKKLCLFSII